MRIDDNVRFRSVSRKHLRRAHVKSTENRCCSPNCLILIFAFALLAIYVAFLSTYVRRWNYEENTFNQMSTAAAVFLQKEWRVRNPSTATAQEVSQRGERPSGTAYVDYGKDHPTPDFILKAFLEPLNYSDWDVKPLPNRTYAKAENLKELSYPELRSCSRLQQQFPIDVPPCDEDPFLPWIHDVFPLPDGKSIQFVAQNRRRCRSGIHVDRESLDHMQPQSSLLQHISLKRLKDDRGETRFRLVGYEDADADAITTRFICRFKSTTQSFGETLSVHNVDYDYLTYRKRYAKTVYKEDGGVISLHTSQLNFKCPVPAALQETVRTGTSVNNDWTSLFVDLIPVRSPPRYGLPHRYLAPWYSEFKVQEEEEKFDPTIEYGENHILPLIQDSGRWESIPICKPSLMTYGSEASKARAVSAAASNPEKVEKTHRLISCIWASAVYKTRGDIYEVSDGPRRLLEWITYHKLIGFDQFYVYDNSAAFGNETSFKPIADLFPDHVTYIPWPSKICNNNPSGSLSPGERSSQYAAESSCHLRFGPHTDWIGQFDIDEYIIPMGNHTSIKSMLDGFEKEDTRIVSFGSWRALPRLDLMKDPEQSRVEDVRLCPPTEECFRIRIPSKVPLLQAYNCDVKQPGSKVTMPAEKQLYQPDYVLQHFVHYSAATVMSMKNKSETEKAGFAWRRRPFPDYRERWADELNEGVMLHGKTVAIYETSAWERLCKENTKIDFDPRKQSGLMCRLGFPWPTTATTGDWNAATETNQTEDGWYYNCFVNEKAESYFVPRLTKELVQFSAFIEEE